MALQLGQFKPLNHNHYQLAKTQSEYDEDARREMAIDNNNFANRAVMANMEQQNANNRLGAKLAQDKEQSALDQQNIDADRALKSGLADADQRQQAFSNDLATKKLGLDQANIAADNRRANIQLGLSQAQESRNQEAYNQAQQEKQQRLALAQFGSRLLSSEPDKDGRVDVTDNFDTINTLAGGGMDKKQFKRVFAQNTGDKTILMGEGEDGKPSPVMRNGNPVTIRNEILMKSAMFADGEKDGKYSSKTVRGGMDEQGNVLPDRLAVVNERTGEVRFTDAQGDSKKQPELSSEEALAKLGEVMRGALTKPEQKQPPGLGDAVTPSTNQLGTAQNAAQQPTFIVSSNPGQVLDSLRANNRLSNEDEISLQKASRQGGNAVDERIMQIRDRIVNFGY